MRICLPKLIFISFLFFILSACQQKPTPVPPTPPATSTNMEKQSLKERYTLYKTDNYYTFIKLDTQTGQLWQIHWCLKEDCTGIVELSSKELAHTQKPGRFRLFSTANMYNFILLDEIDGRTWQVQWSHKEKERGIWPIEDY